MLAAGLSSEAGGGAKSRLYSCSEGWPRVKSGNSNVSVSLDAEKFDVRLLMIDVGLVLFFKVRICNDSARSFRLAMHRIHGDSCAALDTIGLYCYVVPYCFRDSNRVTPLRLQYG